MENVIGIVTSLVTTAAEYTIAPMINQIKYVCNYENKVQSLKDQTESLKDAKERVQHSVDAAKRNGEEIEHDVDKWLTTVNKKIDEEIEKVMQDEEKAKKKCFLGLCPSFWTRYKLSMKAEEEAKTVAELLRQGKFDSVSYRAAPQPQVIMASSVKGFEAFESRRLVLNGIMEALKEVSIKVIGVHGMGGVGKTTLVKEVARQVNEGQLFDSVVIATVTQTLDVENIQNQIADSLGLKFEEQSMGGRTVRLRDRLNKEKKILLVLDDIWARLDLEEVGIPFGNENEGCKILLTSRDLNVLSSGMDTQKNFAVDILNEEEAWDLFKKMAGDCVERCDLRSTAIEVAKKCAGLPIAIATVARALKDKSLFEWENALRELERPSSGHFTGITEANSAIELSYNYLESEEVKQTFLLCSLIGHNGLIEDLLKYIIGLGYFQGVYKIKEARNKVLTVVSKLKSSCLLLDSYNNERFDIHDVVWSVALSIASRDHHMFVLRDGEEWPDKERMKNCCAIYLRSPSIITELPDELEWSGLRFLYMAHDGSVKIPANFFRLTERLKVLDFTGMHFPSLPESINLLTNIHTLCLDRCVLEDISIIGKLKSLEILSLFDSDIKELPREIAQLTRLKLLNLSRTELKIIPPNVLSKLSKLEELYMEHSFTQWEEEVPGTERRNASLEELRHLTHLTTLYAHIPNAHIIPECLFIETLDRYRIFIGDYDEWDWYHDYEYSRTLKFKLYTSIYLDHGVKILLKKTEDLYLDQLKGIKNVLDELNNGEGFPHLKKLHVKNGLEVQYIATEKFEFSQLQSMSLEDLPQLISFSSKGRRCSTSQQEQGDTSTEPLFNKQIVFPQLKSLRLSSIKIQRIWHNQLSETCSFPYLKSMIIQGCGNLERLLLPSVARSLVHLQQFEIVGCECLREIIFSEEIEEGKNDVICFPQLNSLRISDLQNLIKFCSGNLNIEFPSLKVLNITHCPKLKEFINETKMEGVQALFNEKVVCPKLNSLELSSINIEKIWDLQQPASSLYVQNLERFTIKGCHNLKHLFPSFMVKHFVQLEQLKIRDCKIMEEVIFFKEGLTEEEERMSKILFPKLEFLSLKDLPKLARFCYETHNEFPLLITLKLKNCPEMMAFVSKSVIEDVGDDSQIDQKTEGNNLEIYNSVLFNEKVVFPSLNSLTIERMRDCRKIWQDQLTVNSFCELNDIRIEGCETLSNIFPFNMMERLEELEKLQIVNCDSVEEIFEPQGLIANQSHQVTSTQSIAVETEAKFVFPKVTCLRFDNLPKLKHFYSRIHATEWPSLKKMEVIKCHKVERFASESPCFGETQTESQVEISNQEPLFWVNEVTFPILEELKLEPNHTLNGTWHGQLSTDCFRKLKVLELINVPGKSAALPYCFIRSLPDLETFILNDASFCQIFQSEALNDEERHASVLTRLSKLRLSKLPNLVQLWKEEFRAAFCNLRILEVEECGKLMTLVPSLKSFKNLTTLKVSRCHGFFNLIACSAAKSLMLLERMSISDCKMIKEIIASEGEASEDEEIKGGIVFTQLKYLQLSCLPNLASFSLGDHIFEFPALEKVIVRECPKMENFCKGDLSTPKLQRVQLKGDEERGRWDGNLKTTIQQLFKEMNVQNSEEGEVNFELPSLE